MSKDEIKYKIGKHPNSQKNLKSIKEGEVRNPNGARAHDPHRRYLKKMSSTFLKDVLDAAFIGNLTQLQNIIKDNRSESVKVGVATCILKAIKTGDWKILDMMLERILGKTTITADLSNTIIISKQDENL